MMHRVLWTAYTSRNEIFLSVPTPDHAEDVACAYELWLSEVGLSDAEVADHAKAKRLSLIAYMQTHGERSRCR